MATMTVSESVMISLGLDSSGFFRAFVLVEQRLALVRESFQRFEEGFQQGFSGTARAIASEAGQAAKSVERVGTAAAGAAGEMEAAGNLGREAMSAIENQAERANTTIKKIGSGFVELGVRWGAALKGVVSRLASTALSSLASGSMITDYFNRLGELAQKGGSDSTRLEKLRKERELLNRITEEDVALYRKAELALLEFDFAVSGLGITIMRALLPVITAGVNALRDFSGWVQRNESNILRFFSVLASVITGVLVPAFIVWGVTLLANPITWIVAGVLLLTSVLYDLLTYMNSGSSFLSDFWARFGTGAEIAKSLAKAWADLKSVGAALFGFLGEAASRFFGRFGDALPPLLNAFENFIKMIAALLSGDFLTAVERLMDVLLGLAGGILKVIFSSESLKPVGTALFSALQKAASVFFTYFGASLPPLLNALKSFVQMIGTLLVGDFDKAFGHLKDVLLGLGESFIKVVSGLGDALIDLALSITKSVSAYFADIFMGWIN